MNVKELEQMILLSLKHLKGSGELSSIKQMFLAVTSPEFLRNDLKWFLTASNSENIMNCQKELVEYMYFDFNVEKQATGIPCQFVLFKVKVTGLHLPIW